MKVFATDLDGTLFYPKKIKRCIPKKNAKFLRDWIDEGNRAVLITSRGYEFAKKLKAEIERPVDFICCTSSQIYIDDKLVKDTYMNNQALKEIINYLDEHNRPVAYLMTTKNHQLVIKQNKDLGFFFKSIYRLWHFFQFSYRENYILDNKVFDEELENGECYKVMVFYGFGKKKKQLSKDINKVLREKYPDIESSWSSIVNELTPVNCNKGAGLEFYTNYLKVNKEDVYVVGDSGNDITMFNKFNEHSYCMTHAYPSVKKYAKHTISRIYKLRKIILKGEK